MKPRAAQVSVNPSGLVVVTGTDVQAALAQLDAAVYTDEKARDALAAALVAGTGISIVPDDTANTITITNTGGGGGGGSYTDEQVRDVIGAALVAGSNVTITVNDAGDTITIAAAGFPGFVDYSETNTQVSTTATNTAQTVLHSRTLVGLTAGTYNVDFQYYVTASAGGKIWIRCAGAVVNEYATHNFGGPKTIFGRYVHGATGDLLVELVHVSEGSSLQYGIGTDPRFGRKCRVTRVV